MKRLGFSAALAWVLVSILSAQTPAPARSVRRAAAVPPAAPDTFKNYCFECHGTDMPEAGLSLERLISEPSVGPHWQEWEKVTDMLETGMMPPPVATAFPTDAERAAATAW